MTVFLSTSRITPEKINAADVVRIREEVTNRGRVTVATLRDGHTVNLMWDATRAAELCCPVVPAHPGFEFLTAWDGMDEIYFHHTPIIAWRMEELGPVPITPDDDRDTDGTGQATAILYPNGQVCCPFEATYDSEEKWKEQVAIDFKERREAAAARAAAKKAADSA